MREKGERILMFVNTKREAERLTERLNRHGYPAEELTGDIDQRKRLRVLEAFKKGEVPILVATDVASRGLHIEGVTHVVNYDIPQDPEDYVHRVGRTARAGAEGEAIRLAGEGGGLGAAGGRPPPPRRVAGPGGGGGRGPGGGPAGPGAGGGGRACRTSRVQRRPS